MKKLSILLSATVFVLIMTSCSSAKEGLNYKKSINGAWQLRTITTEGITGKIKAQVLNEADFNCFVGSAWNFNKSNNLGFYSINKNGKECAAVKRNFRWSVSEETGAPKMLQYKRLDDKYKEIDEGDAGFRFTIITLEKNTMQIKSDINFEGKPASFIYNFVKN